RPPPRRRDVPGTGAGRPPDPVAADLRIRHGSVRTPLGEMTVVASERGVLATGLGDERSAFLGWAEERFEARAVRGVGGLRGELDGGRASVEGSLRRFRSSVGLSPIRSEFFLAVYEAAIAVPYGELRTYGDLAGAAGRPRAARAAGHAMRTCPIELWIPCH